MIVKELKKKSDIYWFECPFNMNVEIITGKLLLQFLCEVA